MAILFFLILLNLEKKIKFMIKLIQTKLLKGFILVIQC